MSDTVKKLAAARVAEGVKWLDKISMCDCGSKSCDIPATFGWRDRVKGFDFALNPMSMFIREIFGSQNVFEAKVRTAQRQLGFASGYSGTVFVSLVDLKAAWKAALADKPELQPKVGDILQSVDWGYKYTYVGSFTHNATKYRIVAPVNLQPDGTHVPDGKTVYNVTEADFQERYKAAEPEIKKGMFLTDLDGNVYYVRGGVNDILRVKGTEVQGPKALRDWEYLYGKLKVAKNGAGKPFNG